MARYGTFKYSTETYGKTTTGVANNILYALHVDWDGDGSYDGAYNEANRVLDWTIDRGRDTVINPSGSGFTPYSVGTFRITLDNYDGRYDPWNSDSPLYGNLMPGKKMQFRVGVTSIAEEITQQTAVCSCSAVDGYVFGANASHDTAFGTPTEGLADSSALYLGQKFDDPTYYCYRTYLKFDTSVIPADSTIDQVNLRMTCYAKNTDDGDFDVEIIKQDWSAFEGLSTLVSTDLNTVYDDCMGGDTDTAIWKNTADVTAGVTYDSGDLSTAWVNPGENASTYYSLISSEDLAKSAPTGEEYIQLYSQDYVGTGTEGIDNYRPKLVVKYTPVTVNYHYVFTGIVTDIQLDGWRKTATLVCEDGWRFLADNDMNDINNHVYPTSNYGLYTGHFSHVLWNAGGEDGLPQHPYYPWGYNIQPYTGTNLQPFFYFTNGSSKSILEEMIFGSLSRAWIDTENVFQARGMNEQSDSPVITIDESMILDNIYLPMPWENKRTRVILKSKKYTSYAYNPTTGSWTGLDVYTLATPVKIDAGETVEIFIKPKYSDWDNIYIADNGWEYSYRVYENDDETGTRIHDIKFKTYFSKNSAVASITNESAIDGYITYLKAYYHVIRHNDIMWEYYDGTESPSNFTLESDWLAVTNYGTTDNIFSTSDTQADYQRKNSVGHTMLDYLSIPRPFPVVQMRGRHNTQFSLDLEDKVTLTLPIYNIDENFRIHKISHQTVDGLQDILTTLWLYPVIEPST